MDPLIGASLVKLGGDLLGGLIAPSQRKQLKWQRESDQKQRAWQANQITNTLRPKMPYYQSGNLPQLGGSAYSAVMGNLMQRMGPEMLAKWGINPAPAAPAAGAPAAPPLAAAAMQQKRQQFPGQSLLMQRYGG